MKPIHFLSFLLTAIPVFAQPHVSSVRYQNFKVIRIPTGQNTLKLESLVTEYQLNLWTEHALPNSHLDVEVPPEKYTNFTRAVDAVLKEEGITTPIVTMHENLGESIRKEGEGSLSVSQLRTQGTVLTLTLVWLVFTMISFSKRVRWLLLPGSTATIPTLTT